MGERSLPHILINVEKVCLPSSSKEDVSPVSHSFIEIRGSPLSLLKRNDSFLVLLLFFLCSHNEGRNHIFLLRLSINTPENDLSSNPHLSFLVRIVKVGEKNISFLFLPRHLDSKR